MFEKIKKTFEGGPSRIFTFLSIFLLILMTLFWLVDDSKSPKVLSHS